MRSRAHPLTSLYDQNKLVNEKINSGFPSNSGAWIGLNDINNENTFVWEDGSGDSSNYFEYFGNNLPDGGTNQNCVVMRFLAGRWNDLVCSRRRRFICNYPQYIFVSTPKKNFSEANNYCIDNYGTSLAYINSEDSNNKGYSMMINENENEAWIGIKGYDSGVFGEYEFKWQNNSDNNDDAFLSTWTKWDIDNNEPNVENGLCGQFDSVNNDIFQSWNLNDCSNEKSFLCNTVSYT